jgi:hypothetical protein
MLKFSFQLHHFALVCLFHNVILLTKCIEICRVILATSITFDCFDILSSLIFYQSFENLKVVNIATLTLGLRLKCEMHEPMKLKMCLGVKHTFTNGGKCKG